MKFYIVDAFTETLFGGNPAGVVILPPGQEFPPDEVMVRTAAELRYSETVFLRQNVDGGYQLRYFTPTEEVDLCGHATVGAFSALWKSGEVSAGTRYSCETKAGKIEVRVLPNLVMMDMATPQEGGTIREEGDLEELCGIMNLEISHIGAEGEERFYPEIISTGLPDILLPVTDRNTLGHIRPDYPALAALSKKYGVVGIHAFSLGKPGEDVTAYCRNFAPAFGINEEAATGTSNGALTYYLYKHGLKKAGEKCLYVQGESMGRPSKIAAELQAETAKISIGGTGVILAEGEIYI